jgi:hypothetical protein
MGAAQHELMILFAVAGICLAIAVPRLVRLRADDGARACALEIDRAARELAADRAEENAVEITDARPRFACPRSGEALRVAFERDPADPVRRRRLVRIACPEPARHALPGEAPPALAWAPGEPALGPRFAGAGRVTWALVVVPGAVVALLALYAVTAVARDAWRALRR